MVPFPFTPAEPKTPALNPAERSAFRDLGSRLASRLKGADELHCRVLIGGPLSDNKGINRRGGGLTAPALTEKDKVDIKLAAEMDLDYLAVSFPRDAADMELARKLLRDAGGHGHVCAKIERHEAIHNLIEIIDASDAIMVARGDLAVEMGYAEITGLQKTIIHESRTRNKVVITATQMMESMISAPVPSER